MKQDSQMNGNVIKFRKRKPQKKPQPRLRKLLTVLAVVVALIAAWAYFTLVGQSL